MSTISELQDWYSSQCDGVWEHDKGISIDTLDNPGWHLKVNLVGTKLEFRKCEEIKVERSETDWYVVRCNNGLFEGFCGSRNLEEVLIIFLRLR